jgi:hypothetical protein
MSASFLVNRRKVFASTSVALVLGSLGDLRAQVVSPTAVTVRLPIAPRLQWEELDGYCGECCIQQAALYFGTYVSQYVCRGIINPNQKSQLLVGLNEHQVLSALRLGYAAFGYNKVPSPQFPAYFVWLKQHLSLLRPVLITAYVRGLSDPDYDHIMLATGFTGLGTVNYNPADQLAFNDCFHPLVFNRAAATLSDNRRMRVNGAKYEYCIPGAICYGCAITGIQDTSRLALPVQISMATWNEPDLMAGAAPVMLNGTVTVSGLIPGKSYCLYRYNDYRVVPTANYAKSSYSSVLNFVAPVASVSFPVTIPSNGVAVFRCLPAGK